MKDRFGYKPPIDHKLGYAQSLARLKVLFADNRDDDVGHKAQILPEVFYGENTKRCLEIYESNEQYQYWLETPEKRLGIARKTATLLYSYRYVALGIDSYSGNRALERLLLRGPSVMRHELVQPPQEQLVAAELWRFRSGLLNYAQAKALYAHLNSFRRTSAHGKVLDWSICEGPGPDTDLSTWLQEKDGYSHHLHRNADGLAGFGIDGELGDKVAQFKLVHRCTSAGMFSYRPAPPVIEPMYHVECVPKEDSLVKGSKLHVRVAKRENCADSTRRERVLKYANYAGAFPDVPEYETGLVTEDYYFLKDEEETGVPLVDCGMRPFEAVNELFTAEAFRNSSSLF